MDSSISDQAPEEDIEDKIPEYLWMYGNPVILIFGTLGNVFSFFVLQTGTFRQSTSGLLLSLLVVLDTLFLNTELLRECIRTFKPSLDITASSSTGCILFTFVTRSLPLMSSWTLVLLTAERVFTMIKGEHFYSRKRGAICWVLLVVRNGNYFGVHLMAI